MQKLDKKGGVREEFCRAWKDTDARQNVNIFAISRIAYLLMTVLSSFLNPIIYMTLQKDLRYHVYHVLGIRNQIGNIQNQP